MNFVEPGSRLVAASKDPASTLRWPRKWPISYRSFGTFAVLGDAAIILVCGVLSGAFYNSQMLHTPAQALHHLATAAVVAAFFISVMKGNQLYGPEELLDLRAQIGSVITTWSGVFFFLAGAVFALKIGNNFSRVAIFSFAGSGLGLLVVERVFYRLLLRRGLSGQRFACRNAALITDQRDGAASQLAGDLLKYGFRLRRHFVLPALMGTGEGAGSVSDIAAYLRGSDIDEVVVGADVTRWGNLSEILFSLRSLPLPVMVIPVGAAASIFSRPMHMMGNSVCIEVQREPLGAFERAAKRTVDAVVSLAALILLLPLLAATALLIKLDSPGPVLFRQKRCGFNGRLFEIFKFRTMSVLENGPTVVQATWLDGRVTRVGRWLRKSSIDELPQLLNVLGGSMSLVGPRPHAVAHDSQFDKLVSRYAFRHHVKPGLTGWAQVNGHRGPTPTEADIRRRVEYDLWYIDNWSFGLDALIIIRTLLEVLRGRNAF